MEILQVVLCCSLQHHALSHPKSNVFNKRRRIILQLNVPNHEGKKLLRFFFPPTQEVGCL